MVHGPTPKLRIHSYWCAFFFHTHKDDDLFLKRYSCACRKNVYVTFSSSPQRRFKRTRWTNLQTREREREGVERVLICVLLSVTKKGERNDICSRSVFHFFWKWIFGSLSKPPILSAFFLLSHSHRTLLIILGYIKDRFASSFFFFFGTQFFFWAAAVAAAALPFHLQLYNLFLSHHPSICIKNSNRCHSNEIHERTTKKMDGKKTASSDDDDDEQKSLFFFSFAGRHESDEDSVSRAILFQNGGKGRQSAGRRSRKKKRHKINFHK